MARYTFIFIYQAQYLQTSRLCYMEVYIKARLLYEYPVPLRIPGLQIADIIPVYTGTSLLLAEYTCTVTSIPTVYN